MQTQLNNLKSQIINNNNNNNNNNIGQKYFDSLLSELLNNGLLNNDDAQNIQNKVKLKLLTLEEVINSLELLKQSNKHRQPNNDMKYNELPLGFYTPIGDKIANEWDNEYTLLNTDKWSVPMQQLPICINNLPSKVYPSFSSNAVNLKDWDNSRVFTTTSINNKWVNYQNKSNFT